jgi:hypothetical protein
MLCRGVVVHSNLFEIVRVSGKRNKAGTVSFVFIFLIVRNNLEKVTILFLSTKLCAIFWTLMRKVLRNGTEFILPSSLDISIALTDMSNVSILLYVHTIDREVNYLCTA